MLGPGDKNNNSLICFLHRTHEESRQLSRYSDWLRAERSDDRGSILGGGLGIFPFDTVSIPALGLTPVCYPMDIGGSFPGGKAAGA
jgi:hypothetical protein